MTRGQTKPTEETARSAREARWKRLQAELGEEFDRYVLEHPEILQTLPEGAVLCFEVEDKAYEGFNRWSRELAEQHAADGHPIARVRIRRLRPRTSRIIEAEAELLAPPPRRESASHPKKKA